APRPWARSASSATPASAPRAATSVTARRRCSASRRRVSTTRPAPCTRSAADAPVSPTITGEEDEAAPPRRAHRPALRQGVLVGGPPGPERLRVAAGGLRGRDVGVELRDLLAADCAQRLLNGDAAHPLRVLAH